MGRSLSIKLKLPLFLDTTSGFTNDFYKRDYLLNHFNISALEANPYESYVGLYGKIRRRKDIYLNNFDSIRSINYIREIPDFFDEEMFRLSNNKNIYVEGFWQTELYFKDIATLIREDLKIISKHSEESINLAEMIKDTNAISLHIRSYDEVPKNHGATFLSINYYQNAINEIAKKVKNPHFYCFSDNVTWMTDNLKLDYPATIVNLNLNNCFNSTIEDLWLMSKCKHHIIANSTFSWWGAYLNQNTDKIVVCPQDYIGPSDQANQFMNKNYYPKEWIAL
jgi:hypothetical protein